MTKKDKERLREDYLSWLEAQLRDESGNLDKTYWDLLNLMFEKKFIWLVPMDDNRIQDGRDLRVEFTTSSVPRFRKDSTAVLLEMAPISFLEVLIALSRKLAFTAGGTAPGWAWQLLNNLELHRMYDPLTPQKRNRAEEILDTVIQRKYLPNGEGGFFPLAWPEEDMTQVELWYQLNDYVSEL